MNNSELQSDEPLKAACALWQSGRDSGSSPLRAAARVLTATAHYFDADFIRDFEAQARQDESLQRHAEVLLDRLATAPKLTAEAWGDLLGVQGSWVGRGTPGGAHAEQIRDALATGTISMPLWGVTLNPDVAATFGDQFTFEIVGPFPAIVATRHSGVKQHELELITGGSYKVDPIEAAANGGVLARLEFVQCCRSL